MSRHAPDHSDVTIQASRCELSRRERRRVGLLLPDRRFARL